MQGLALHAEWSVDPLGNGREWETEVRWQQGWAARAGAQGGGELGGCWGTWTRATGGGRSGVFGPSKLISCLPFVSLPGRLCYFSEKVVMKHGRLSSLRRGLRRAAGVPRVQSLGFSGGAKGSCINSFYNLKRATKKVLLDRGVLNHSVASLRRRIVVVVFKVCYESSLSPLNLVGFPLSASEILSTKS